MKVLVAEDDEGWRELLGFWLKQAGYEVTLCSDGLGVMPAARQDPPQGFVLDFDLGDITGGALCRALKQDPAFKDKPVVILTANAQSLPGLLSEAYPPDQFVAKSQDPFELLNVLELLLPPP